MTPTKAQRERVLRVSDEELDNRIARGIALAPVHEALGGADNQAERELKALLDLRAARAELAVLRAKLAAMERVLREVDSVAELCLLDGDRIVQTSAFEDGAPRHAAGLALERIRAAVDALKDGGGASDAT